LIVDPQAGAAPRGAGIFRSGLLGRAILASRSAWLHEQEARAQGLALTYELFDFDARGLADAALPAMIATLRDSGYDGFNVTYPFKQAIIPLLDELADSATLVGAVNTVAIRNGRMTGHNTDLSGFRDSVRDGLAGATLDRVLQLGAGGAGSAVATALLSLGAKVLHIVDVDAARAASLVEALRARFPDRIISAAQATPEVAREVDGVVNATPVGMSAYPGTPLDVALLRPRVWVADIVYFPLETALLRAAREKGCRVLNGTGMVIGQAAVAFEIITGHKADARRMRESFFARPEVAPTSA
jgi:shikimate dehydrogenase